jgi:hypothetical protein
MRDLVFDFFGHSIKIGDVCVYPMRRGSKMWMQIIRVDGIELTDNGYVLTGYDGNGRRTRTRNTENCVIVPKPELRVDKI